MTIESTFLCIKPDAVQRGLVGEILSAFERKGFLLLSLKTVWLRRDTLRLLYPDLDKRSYCQQQERIMLSGPSVVVAVRGNDAIRSARKIAGDGRTPELDDLSTIRGQYASWTGCDVIHSAATSEEASRQLASFFSADELKHYDRCNARFFSNEAWDHYYDGKCK